MIGVQWRGRDLEGSVMAWVRYAVRLFDLPSKSEKKKGEAQWRRNWDLNPLLTTVTAVFPEKLTVPQLAKKFPAFYGTRRLITAFTTARHWFLSSARIIQLTSIRISFKIQFNIIHPSMPKSYRWFHNFRLPHQNSASIFLHPIRATCNTNLILSQLTNPWLETNYGVPHYVVFSIPVTPSLIVPNISLSTLFPTTLSLCSSLNVGNQVSQPHKAVGKNYNSLYMNPCTQIWTHELLKTELTIRHCSRVVRRFPLSQSPRTPRAAVGRSVCGPV